MKKQYLGFAFLLLCAFSITAQTEQARKIDEFKYVPCGDFGLRASAALVELMKSTGAKIYVIYYEGKHQTVNVWNKQFKRYESRLLNPRRGDALGRAKELELYLKTNHGFTGEVPLIDGGYQKKFTIEFWIVPKNAERPKLEPTLLEKDIIFRKGKPFKPRDCAKIYDGL